MTTHRDIAELVAALYGEPGSPEVQWLDRSLKDAPVCWAAIRLGRLLVTCFRGSVTFKDWVHDLQAVSQTPLEHPLWGRVHPGFYLGTPEAWSLIKTLMGPGDLLVLAGHSLGAAHADMVAGHALAEGVKPHYLLTWGEPKPGQARFAQILAGVPGIGYCNENAVGRGHDLVTDLPFSFPPELYTRRAPLKRLHILAVPENITTDLGGAFAWHHFFLYRDATPPTEIVEPAE